jgi:nicotinate-nucleotide adenylyltransferase
MSAREKLGLFGGSFDPIHAGHVAPVRDARAAVGLDRVLYLPTARPPHKPGREFAPPWRRFAMVELALLDEEGLYASARELTPDREVYTIDTVEALAAELPEAELHLIVGSDSLAELDTWRRWRELIERVRLVAVVRPGFEPEAIAPGLPPELRARLDAGAIRFVARRPLPWSATALRAAFARGDEPPAGALHPRVLDYIRKYRLYR